MFFFFQAEDGIRDHCVTGVQTCALPILHAGGGGPAEGLVAVAARVGAAGFTDDDRAVDRKSTRLNSSHTVISYAVFCLKKKEHTSELQSHSDLVCRLLLEKKKK